jgi:predicted secreted protein
MTYRPFLLAAMLSAAAVAHADQPPTAPVAQAAAPTQEAAPAPAQPAAKTDEKVCKLERQLGSNKMKRVCHSRADLDRQSEAARDALSREQRR